MAGFAHSAMSAPLCTTYAGPGSSTNGGSTLPGTDVGTVGLGAGQVCQIGNLGVYNGGNGGAYVPNGSTPSIYSFYFAGGVLSLTEQSGNNGYPGSDGLAITFGSLASNTSTSLTATLATLDIPYSAGPSKVDSLLSNVALAPGYYAVETALGGGGSGTPGPNFQIDVNVPEPATLALLAVPALAVAARRRSRR